MTYPSNETRVHGMAIAALILGILGFFSIGLLGIVGLILGIISNSTINKSRGILTGKGMAMAGIITGAISLTCPLLLIAALPSLGKSKELSQRSTCAANIRGITQSMNVYAADENGAYPIIAKNGTPTASTAFGSGDPGTNVDRVINSMYAGSPTPSVSQNMWLLVLKGQVAAKQFLCKSDPSPTHTAMVTNGSGAYLPNFNDGNLSAPANSLNSTSYGTAFPWVTNRDAIGGWWRDNTDAALPLIADMGPADGTGSNPVASTPSAARAANSFIHQRDGQNVGFGDAHAEFQRRTDIGHSNDNIYTSGNNGVPSASGSPIISTGAGAPSNYDVILVPFMNGNTFARQVP